MYMDYVDYIHRRRFWGAARARAPTNLERPCFHQLLPLFAIPSSFCLPQYLWQVYASDYSLQALHD